MSDNIRSNEVSGKHPVEELAEMLGADIKDGGRLPDGSGFAILSTPLPKDHWIYATDADGFTPPPPMSFRMGSADPRRQQFNEMVRAAARYAIKASTMCGKDMDFDPDAMVQNFVVGMLGYHTADGLSGESFGNPDPVPARYPGYPGDNGDGDPPAAPSPNEGRAAQEPKP